MKDASINRLTALGVYTVAICYFFYTIVQLSIFNALSPHLLRDFDLSGTGLGLLSSLYLYTLVIILLPTGTAIDRYLTRWPAIFSLSLLTLGSFTFALHPSISTAVIYRIAGGVGNAFAFVCAMRVCNYWFPEKRALATSLAVSFALLGGMLTGAPLTHFIEGSEWIQAMMYNSVAGLALLVLLLFFLKNHEDEQTEKTPISFSNMKTVLINFQNSLCGFFTGCLNTSVYVLAALWGNLYLVQRFGLSTVEATSITSMIFLGTIIGSPLFGMLSDLMKSRKKPMIIGAILSIITLAVIIELPSLNYYTILSLFILLGITTSSQVISYPTIAESNPMNLISTATACAAILINLVAAIVQVLFGWILTWQWSGDYHNGVPQYAHANWNWGMLTILIVFILGLLSSFMVRETHCQSLPQDPKLT